MSELRAYRIKGVTLGDFHDVYIKSDADKVIADLEKSHKKEEGQLLMEIAELKKQVHDYAQGLYVIQARAEKEAQHDKYKRCLAIAERCYTASVTMYVKRDTEPIRECKYWYHYRGIWWEKWQRKWLELAEKFKEGDKCRG